MSSFLHPGSASALKNKFGILDRKDIIRFNSLDIVLESIKQEDQQTFFLAIINYGAKTHKIFRAISQKRCKYGVTGAHANGFFPEYEYPKFYKRVIKSFYNMTFFKRISENLIQKYFSNYFSLHGMNCANYYALSGGSHARVSGPIIGEDTVIQHIHAHDYDLFSRHKHLINKKNNQNFIVFIDQAFPYHPDAGLYKRKSIDADEYYGDLKKFFNLVELQTKLDVVIAAHPKADYNDKGSPFGSRKVVSGDNSAELIANSKSVIMHYSTAINLVVLFKKQTLFITTNMLDATYRGGSIKALSKYFNTTPLNINNFNDKIIFPLVDETLYNDYKAKYIKKPGTKEGLFWQQVADHISESY